MLDVASYAGRLPHDDLQLSTNYCPLMSKALHRDYSRRVMTPLAMPKKNGISLNAERNILQWMDPDDNSCRRVTLNEIGRRSLQPNEKKGCTKKETRHGHMADLRETR